MSTIEQQGAPATPAAIEAGAAPELRHGVVALWQLVYQGVVGAGPERWLG